MCECMFVWVGGTKLKCKKEEVRYGAKCMTTNGELTYLRIIPPAKLFPQNDRFRMHPP